MSPLPPPVAIEDGVLSTVKYLCNSIIESSRAQSLNANLHVRKTSRLSCDLCVTIFINPSMSKRNRLLCTYAIEIYRLDSPIALNSIVIQRFYRKGRVKKFNEWPKTSAKNIRLQKRSALTTTLMFVIRQFASRSTLQALLRPMWKHYPIESHLRCKLVARFSRQIIESIARAIRLKFPTTKASRTRNADCPTRRIRARV